MLADDVSADPEALGEPFVVRGAVGADPGFGDDGSDSLCTHFAPLGCT